MRNKPRIRFKGFTEDWEQRKLGEVVKSYSGGTPTASNKEYYGGDIPFIRSAEINSDTTELYITQKGLDNSSAKIVEKGTILYAMYGATSGEVGISKINGAINQAILAMIPLNYDGKIIAQYLRKNKESIIGKYLQGGQGNLSANIILELPIQLPGLEESNQIAYFLESVDNIITLHQRKLEKLKLAKKALLQKLFPKNGSQFPEIRFKDFTDAWEQCKLGDLLILLKDGSHGTHKNTSEGVYLLSAKNIKNGRINIMPDDRIISWDDYNVIHKSYELQSGDILLTIVGSIGETAIYNLKTKVTFQRSVAFLRPNSKLKNGFLYTLINTDRFQNQLQTKQVVSAQPGIYLGDLASINITYPKNVLEQEKIYNIFKGIENSITLHQRKLDKLQEVKKGLLQKMFV